MPVFGLLQETVGYKDACEMMGCSKSYLHALKKAGELPYIVHAGKVRFYIDGIEAYGERLKKQAYQNTDGKWT